MGDTKVDQFASYRVETEEQAGGEKRQVIKVAESAPATGSGLGVGNKDVTAAGTAEPLVAATTACKKIYLTAKDNNTGKIYWGSSSVDSTNGDYLFPAGKTAPIEIDDVNKVYIDAEKSGDGVKFTYIT